MNIEMNAARIILIALYCLLPLTGWTGSLDLLQTWQLAQDNDPAWRAAKADRDYDAAEKDKALAGLLPFVSLSLSRSHNELERKTGSPSEQSYSSRNDNLSLRQPLIRLSNIAEYRRAKTQGEAAQHRLQGAAQQLAVRITQLYFEALFAEDQHRSAEQQTQIIKTQLDAAQAAFRAGTGTRIEIDEANARLIQAQAELLATRNARDIAFRRISTLIGTPTGELRRLDAGRIKPPTLSPRTQEDWLLLAESSNPELQASAKAEEAASHAVDRARAGHLPTLDLVASRSRYQSDSVSTINSHYDVDSLGLQFNLPIFSGGYTMAETTQARARHQRTQADTETARQELEMRVMKEFNGVTQGWERLKALRLAQEASQAALYSTQRGVEAGTRSRLDVLNATREKHSVELSLHRAYYDYLLSGIRLQALANRLDEAELNAINALLVQ